MIREGLGLSQSKFATMLGISRRTLEGWEQGRRMPAGPARRLLEVAKRFPEAVFRTAFERTTQVEVSEKGLMIPVSISPARTLSNSEVFEFRAPTSASTFTFDAPSTRTLVPAKSSAKVTKNGEANLEDKVEA